MLLVLPAADANISRDDEVTAICRLIEDFIAGFNARNTDAMLVMYAENAMIWVDCDGELKAFSKQEYRPVLANRMEVLPWKCVTIVDYEIDGFTFDGDTVSFTVDFIGRLSVFTGRATYRVVAKKTAGQWRVIEEEALSPLG